MKSLESGLCTVGFAATGAGRIIGHEGLGVVEAVGKAVRNFRPGDRVIIQSTLGCGSCNYCRAGFYAQCNRINEAGPPGDTVAIFGCGPVGMMAIACAQHMNAGHVFAIDQVPSRLEEARRHGAETIDLSEENPVRVLHELTFGSGPDRVIDAVGVDATCAHHTGSKMKKQFQGEMADIAPDVKKAEKKKWWIGGAPSQVLEWGVESVAKAGTMSIVGVYPPTLKSFPSGMAMNKNITVRMGNCNHRKYLPP